MFIMSNWALIISIYEGWVLKTGHPAIPIVSLILLILSIMVAAETIISVVSKKKVTA